MYGDDDEVAWNELELDELQELLASEIPTMSAEQTAELAELLRAAGGIEGAIELLQQLTADPIAKRSAA